MVHKISKGSIIFSNTVHSQVSFKKKKIEIKGFPLIVEIADTETQKMQGLQYRRDLEEGTGMLFPFPTPRKKVTMHMKNVLIPLDIIFVDPAGLITKIHKAVPEEAKIVGENVLNVIEVSEGWAEKRGITVGASTDLKDERTIDAVMLMSNVEELPVSINSEDTVYKLYFVNDRDFYLTKDSIIIFSDENFGLVFGKMLVDFMDTTYDLVENSDKTIFIKDLFVPIISYIIEKTNVPNKEELLRLGSIIVQKPLTIEGIR